MKTSSTKAPVGAGKKAQTGIVSLILAIMLLSGCAVHNAAVSSTGTPFYLAYDSEEIIRDQSQVATLTSTYGLEIDGVAVNSKNMRSTTTSNATKSTVVVDVQPGEHKVRLTNTQSLGVRQTTPLTHHFEAGRIYNVTIKILPVIEENKSADVAQKIAKNRNSAAFTAKQK
ncbi:MAG: hypothetical protein LBF62_07300 [Tannerellaceae bacterium]|jgi:hypothetical protein|nr:hypothetical protein [Tannerellaceae bacterium]